jgi:hypothetical protein
MAPDDDPVKTGIIKFKEGMDWQLSHRSTSIGGGCVWPDIAFASDGERMIQSSIFLI